MSMSGGPRRPQTASIATSGSPKTEADSGSLILILSGEMAQRFLGVTYLISREPAGVDQVRHDGERAAAEKAYQLVNHSVLHRVAGNRRLEDMGVLIFLAR